MSVIDYNRINFVNEVTKANALNMNNIDKGVKDNNDALKSHEAALKIVTLVYQGADAGFGEFSVDLTDYSFDDQNILKFKFTGTIPQADLSLPAKISVDNNATKYPFKSQDELNSITVGQAKDSEAEAHRDGSNVITSHTFPAFKVIVNGSVISSTFGAFVPLNGGAPQIKQILAVSPEQKANGDLPTDIAEWGATNSVNTSGSGVMINTGNGGGDLPIASLAGIMNLNGVNNIFPKARVRVRNAVCNQILVQVRDSIGGTIQNISIPTPTQDKWYNVDLSDIVDVSGSTNDLDIRIAHEYADAGTANGKVMEIDYLEVLPLDNKPYENESVSELNDRFPVYIAEGINDPADFNLDTIGVNIAPTINDDTWNALFPSSTTYFQNNLLSFDLSGGGGAYVESELIDVKPNVDNIASISLKGNILLANSFKMRILDEDDNILVDGSILGVTTSYAIKELSFNVDVSKIKVRLVRIISSGIITGENLMLNEGTTAETHATYNKANFTVPVGISVGTSQDVVNFVNDKYVLTRKNYIYTLTEDDITGYSSISNVDLVSIVELIPASVDGGNGTSALHISEVEGYTEIARSDRDTVGNDKMFYAYLATPVTFVVATGTYADLAEAKTALAGTLVRYQLETPTKEDVASKGSAIQEEITSMFQNADWALDYTIKFPYNKEAQDEIDRENSRVLRKDFDDYTALNPIYVFDTDESTTIDLTDLIKGTYSIEATLKSGVSANINIALTGYTGRSIALDSTAIADTNAYIAISNSTNAILMASTLLIKEDKHGISSELIASTVLNTDIHKYQSIKADLLLEGLAVGYIVTISKV